MMYDAVRDPLIESVVHNYVVRKRLAEGGMGAVYLAEHQDPRSASKKVIKILLPEFSSHPVIRERFEMEALAVMRLKHPYIVQIDNFGALADGQLYLMMEFLDGETLEQHLQRRTRCDLHHTLHIMAQVMSALQSLHEAGLVHRDLKPANIFIVKTEQNPYEVRLIDLGIARNLAQPEKLKKTVTGMAMGTPGYMAVEQYEDAANATSAADVYAAAVIVWRMLFGQPPWGDIYDERVLYYRQRSADFEPPPDHHLPPEIVALLRKALSTDPAERPSVADFVNLLASYTPARPPFLPSGAMILNDVAKRFIRQASVHDETVRNASNTPVVVPMSWPHRSTQVPSNHDLVSLAPEHSANMVETVSERPVASAPRRTTLSASSGVIDSVSPTRPSHGSRTRVLIAAATCTTAAVIAFAIVHLRGSTTVTDAGVETPSLKARSTSDTDSLPAPGTSGSSDPSASVAPSSASAGLAATDSSPGSAGAPTEIAPAADKATTPLSTPAAETTATTATTGKKRRKTSTASDRQSTSTSPASGSTATNQTSAPPPSSGSGSASSPRPARFDPNAIVE